MNLYFLKEVDTGKVEFMGTAKDLDELLKVFNHYLYNMHIVTDYYQKARLSDQDESQFYIDVIDGYHDDPEKEYLSHRYLVLERQYSPNRIYDRL